MSSNVVPSHNPGSKAVDIDEERKNWLNGLMGDGSLQPFLSNLNRLRAEASQFSPGSRTEKIEKYKASLGFCSLLTNYMRTFPYVVRSKPQDTTWRGELQGELKSKVNELRQSILASGTSQPRDDDPLREPLRVLSQSVISFLEAASTSLDNDLSQKEIERVDDLDKALDALDSSLALSIQKVHPEGSNLKTDVRQDATKLLSAAVDWAIEDNVKLKTRLESSRDVLQQCRGP